MAKAYLLTSQPRTVIFNTSPHIWDVCFSRFSFSSSFFLFMCAFVLFLADLYFIFIE